jgi:Rab GDP dissociation inhibitor
MPQVFKLLFQLSNSEERQVSTIIKPIKLILFVNLDTYISMVSYSHLICAKGIYVAIISTTVETENPEAEIQPAVLLLGDILEMFVSVSTLYEPAASGKDTNLWVTSSYDATSHFESASEDILVIYEQIVGEKLDLNIEAADDEEEY